jgi:hypothetical protein
VLVGCLAQVHPQVEAEAIQVVCGAAGKTKLYTPQRRGIKSHPAIEAVFARQAGTAGDCRQIKTIFAFAISALAFAHDLAENLLVAEGKNLIAGTAD